MIATGLSFWPDKSGNGRNLANATGGTQLVDNGSDASLNNRRTFSSGATKFIKSAAFGFGSTPYIRMVIRQDAWTLNRVILGPIGTTFVQAIYQSSVTPRISQHSGNAASNSSGAAPIASWRVIEAYFSNSANDYLQIGDHAIPHLNSGPGVSIGGFSIGGQNTGLTNPASVSIAELWGFANKITNAERELFRAYEADYYNPNPRAFYVISGNSITAGGAASALYYTDFVSLIAAQLSIGDGYIRDGHSGFTTANLMNGATIAPAISTAGISAVGAKRAALLWEITNDIGVGGANTATAYANVQTWCAAVRALGYKVAVGTAICRSDVGWDAGKEVTRLAVNALVQANWATFADALVDFAADPAFAPPATTTNFDPDLLHPNDTGHAVLASIAAPILAGMAP